MKKFIDLFLMKFALFLLNRVSIKNITYKNLWRGEVITGLYSAIYDIKN